MKSVSQMFSHCKLCTRHPVVAQLPVRPYLCQLGLVEAGSGLQLVVSLVASQRVHLQLEKVDLRTRAQMQPVNDERWSLLTTSVTDDFRGRHFNDVWTKVKTLKTAWWKLHTCCKFLFCCCVYRCPLPQEPPRHDPGIHLHHHWSSSSSCCGHSGWSSYENRRYRDVAPRKILTSI